MRMQIQHHNYTRFITRKQFTINTELNTAPSYNYAQVIQQQEARLWQKKTYFISRQDSRRKQLSCYLYSSKHITYILTLHMCYSN